MLRVLEDSTSKRAVTVQSRENNRRYSGQSRGPGEGADSAMKSLTGVNYAQMLDGKRRGDKGRSSQTRRGPRGVPRSAGLPLGTMGSADGVKANEGRRHIPAPWLHHGNQVAGPAGTPRDQVGPRGGVGALHALSPRKRLVRDQFWFSSLGDRARPRPWPRVFLPQTH